MGYGSRATVDGGALQIMDQVNQLRISDTEMTHQVKASDLDQNQRPLDCDNKNNTTTESEKIFEELNRKNAETTHQVQTSDVAQDQRPPDCDNKNTITEHGRNFEELKRKKMEQLNSQIESRQLICCVCRRTKAQIFYHTCSHFVVCQRCDRNLRYCPAEGCNKYIKAWNRVYI